MPYTKFHIKTIALSLLLLTLLACSRDTGSAPEVRNGVLDLTGWNFNKDGSVSLKGNWKFIWIQDDASFSTEKADMDTWDSLSIPCSWNKKSGSGSGYGWVRMKILLPENNDLCCKENLTLYLSEIFTAYELYINNKKVISNGTFGRDALTSYPKLFPRKINLKLNDDTNTITLALRISNFHHARGGVREAPVLGNYDNISQMLWYSDIGDLLIFGIIIMMIVYHLLLSLNMQHDNASLYFAFCCIVIFFRVFSSNNFIERLFPGADVFELRYKIEYLTISVGCISFTGFFQNLFPADFKKYVSAFIQAAGLILSLVILFTRCTFYSGNVLLFDLFLIFTSLYCIIFIFIAMRRKRDNALLILIGFFIFFITIVNDILHSQSVIYTANLTHFGLTIMIFFQSIAITRRFAQAMKTVARNEQLEDELEIARMITSRLLPREMLHFPGIGIDAYYEPMDKIGGDFYDYSVHNNNLEIFIADVSGHGLPSAFISLITKMSLDQIDDRSKPQTVLKQINTTIMRSTVKSIFVTCFFCVINPVAKSMVYANAGHFPPILYRKDSDEFVELQSKGIALGWFDATGIEESSIVINEGDRILLYTDGILECRNDRGEMFGYDRLKQCIKENKDTDAKGFSRSLIDKIGQFCQHSQMDDDCTFIVVDIEPC